MTSLTVSVDRQDVVHQMRLQVQQTAVFRVDPDLPATVRHDVQVTSVSVSFTGIGVPQVIAVPRHALPDHVRG